MATKHTFRTNGFGETATRRINPLQAIRLQCKECYGFNPAWHDEIENCPSTLCPLYPFRFGTDPGRPGHTEKQKETVLRNIAKAQRRPASGGQKSTNAPE